MSSCINVIRRVFKTISLLVFSILFLSALAPDLARANTNGEVKIIDGQKVYVEQKNAQAYEFGGVPGVQQVLSFTRGLHGGSAHKLRFNLIYEHEPTAIDPVKDISFIMGLNPKAIEFHDEGAAAPVGTLKALGINEFVQSAYGDLVHIHFEISNIVTARRFTNLKSKQWSDSIVAAS